MALTREQVEKFQSIYRKQFGKEISYQDVLDRGYKLVRLMKIIYQPITQNELDDLQKRRVKRIFPPAK